MKKLRIALILQAAVLISLFAPCAVAQDGTGQPPVARKIPHETRIHGYTLKDDYFWLREKKNPEVIKYLETENAYTEEVMKPTKEFQEALYKEILGHIKQTDLSVPSRIGEYYYYSRTQEGKQYPYQCRKKGSPITRSGRPVTAAREVIGIEEVFEASTPLTGSSSSARRKRSFLT